MSFDRLRAVLADVGTEQPTATEISEALWLAAHIGGHVGSPATGGENERQLSDQPRESNKAGTVAGMSGSVDLADLEQLAAGVSPEPEPEADNEAGFDLHLETANEGFDTAGSFRPLMVPSASALHDRLALQRALRPLKQRVSSRHFLALDEAATAERIADGRVRDLGAWSGPPRRTQPSLRPAEERWLRLDIVVDASPSMAVWREHAAELERLMNQLGAFSTVQSWSLHLLAGAATIRPSGVQTGQRSPSAIYGVAGRQAILVMSDCSGAGWWQGTAGRVLTEWGRRAPVAVVQPLPEQLWERTAAPATPGTMRVSRPGLPNSRMKFTPAADFAPVGNGVVVPVLELAAPWFAGWAATVAGTSSAAFPAAAADLGGRAKTRTYRPPGADLTAEQRVLRFRSSASPEAFRLAGYVATTVPRVPVMRLVQQAMFGRSTPTHLAEVILSGLFRTDYSGGAEFAFIEGVRELMLSTLTRSESLSALHVLQNVSRLIESRVGAAGQSFEALLSQPRPSDAAENRAGPSFALISPEALARLAPNVLRHGTTGGLQPEPTASATARRQDHPLPDPLPASWTRPLSADPTLQIRQPTLFVGLGGTGCKVGAELEKRLREELCGPDGTALQAHMRDRTLLPYQLPAFTQFVYADFSAVELQRVRREVVPGREHDQAAQKTMRLITDLVPAGLGNSAEVAQSLRINLGEDTIGWLPPRDTDPRVGPLLRGAGQLPTVGRAVLFETLRRNRDTAMSGLREALSDINKSGGDLMAISGRAQRLDTIQVFVCFSVAGGTGTGIFYDYLHLIGDMMRRAGRHAEIYPLVLMPSGFDEVQGGGRPAELNAGSALIDLFRLVDDQNAPGSIDTYEAHSAHRTVSVRYPASEVVQLPPSMIQTAFLFGRPVGGVRRDDLHRSMASLILSFIGSAHPDEQTTPGMRTSYPTFADDFINRAVERNPMSDTGVGRRGVTTSAVAALTTPLLEITDIVSSHLLAKAVDELLKPPGAAETNKAYIRNFIAAAGLDTMLEAKPTRIPPHQNPAGYQAVLNMLTERANAMAANIERGQDSLGGPIAEQAQKIQPVTGTKVLLRELDLFRARRVLFGHPDLSDPLDRGGFRSLLENWTSPPPVPGGLNAAAPPMPDNLRRGFARLRITDPAVQQVIRRQDTWYAWQTRRLYNAAWNSSRRLWERPWQGCVDELNAVHEQFLGHAQEDRQQFDARCKDLYKPRVGVAYLLPAEDRGLEGFYRTVLDRMKQQYAQQLPPNPHEGHLLNALLGGDGWLAAYDAGRRDPLAAVGYVRQRIKQAVTEQLRPPDGDRPALIPRMEDLLSSAALGRSRFVTDEDLNRFRQKLAELVPSGFTPDGRAPFRTLFTYPASQENRDIERFLRQVVPLPIDIQAEPEFRAVPGESMMVVLLRSSMGVTEVPEVRRVVQLWADAQRSPRPHDYLTWRRRLKPENGYRVMSGEDRRYVLHHLLCAAWDGRIKATGDMGSPERIVIQVGAEDATAMTLRLSALGALSSWATVLQAYEQWILIDDSRARRDLAAKLMSYSPRDADRTPRRPEPEFLALVDLAEQQTEEIERATEDRALSRDPQLAVVREFWHELIPAALHMEVDFFGETLAGLYGRSRRRT